MGVKKGRIFKSIKTAVSKRRSADKSNAGISFDSSARSGGLQPTIEQISEYIQTRAYYIWQQLGKPTDRDLDIWIKAEKQIMAELKKKK